MATITNDDSTNTYETDPVYDEDWVCEGSKAFWQAKGEHALQLYVFPVVIIVGSVCNILAIIVLQTRRYRGTSTGFLMTALALADLGLLATGILRKWILALSAYQTDLRNLSSLGCKFHIFFTYFFQYMSSWTLALITVERAICVTNPFKCKELCSVKKIVMGWLVILLAMVAVNAHFFWSYDKLWDEDWQTYECYGVDAYHVFLYDGVHNWIDLVFPCFAPFLVIIVCNVTIVSRLVMGAIDRRNMKASSGAKPTSSTTVMLLLVSIMFLLLVSPFAIFSLGEAYRYWPSNDARDCAKLDFTYSFTYLLFNLNSAVNFFLYCASGTKFRSAFLSLFCPRKYAASRKGTQRTGTTNLNVSVYHNKNARANSHTNANSNTDMVNMESKGDSCEVDSTRDESDWLSDPVGLPMDGLGHINVGFIEGADNSHETERF